MILVPNRKKRVMKVRALVDFTLHGRELKKGDVFDWSAYRAKLLIERSKVELYVPSEEVEEPKEKVCVTKSSKSEEVRISTRTGKPVRKYNRKNKVK